jgi:hypothetical protein
MTAELAAIKAAMVVDKQAHKQALTDAKNKLADANKMVADTEAQKEQMAAEIAAAQKLATDLAVEKGKLEAEFASKYKRWHLAPEFIDECKWRNEGDALLAEVSSDVGDESEEFVSLVKGLFRAGGAGGQPFRARKVTRVVAVRNLKLQAAFDSFVGTLDARREQFVGFSPDIAPDAEKALLLKRLKERFRPGMELEKANIMWAWHGTSHAAASGICSLGCGDLRGLDGGWFGAGVYVTGEAEYAAGYSDGSISGTPNAPNEQGEYVMLLCQAVVSMTYPVSRETDHDSGEDLSHFHCNYPRGQARRDKALKGGFDSHFVQVSRADGFHAAKDLNRFDFSELVVKNDAQIIPVCLVYFR